MAREALLDRVGRYPRGGVLSWAGDDRYPVSVRCRPRRLAATRDVALDGLPPLAAGWRGPATLLLHRHDERLEGLAQMVLRGTLEERAGATLVLAVADVITANGRDDTDEMPHAGAPLRMLAFYRVGRRKARAYLRRRGTPWPPIPFDEIARRVAEADR